MDSLSNNTAFKPLKSASAASNGYVTGVIAVLRGGDLIVKDSAGNGKIDANGKTYSAICMTVTGEDATGALAKLTVNGGTLIGDYYAIVGNGSRHNTEITINGGTFKGTHTNDNQAIYHPQNGTLTINGGTFEGYNTAIELRGGNLTINDGSFKSQATPTEVQPNGSGTTTKGAAIAVAQHTTKLPINVVINGGTFTGHTALNETNPQNNCAEDVEKIKMEVKGGTFNGTANAVSSADCKNFITGGTFSSEPTTYVAGGYKTVENGNGTWTVSATN
ncbi:MAG: hypothetical protein Q3985_05195 [Eubacteriales bacterium]|nr:hypothetical protein [Eubacteriales bacterium]